MILDWSLDTCGMPRREYHYINALLVHATKLDHFNTGGYGPVTVKEECPCSVICHRVILTL